MNSTRAVAVSIHAVSPESSSSASARAGIASSAPTTPSRCTTEHRAAPAYRGPWHAFGAAGTAAVGLRAHTGATPIVVFSCAIEYRLPRFTDTLPIDAVSRRMLARRPAAWHARHELPIGSGSPFGPHRDSGRRRRAHRRASRDLRFSFPAKRSIRVSSSPARRTARRHSSSLSGPRTLRWRAMTIGSPRRYRPRPG